MKIGIVQGRLLPPINGKIQEFPKDNWEEEFIQLNVLGLNHIEWIITQHSFDYCMNLDVSKYSDRISGITCDHLINVNIEDSNFLAKYLRPVCNWAVSNKIKNINIPLIEKSKIGIISDRFKIRIRSFLSVYPELTFNIEADEYLTEVEQTLSNNSYFKMGFIYDTGNISQCNYPANHKKLVNRMMPYINNIHLKDKNKQYQSTEPCNDSIVDFHSIFKELNKNRYDGLFTLQTARGEDGKEIETILRHKKIFQDLWRKV